MSAANTSDDCPRDERNEASNCLAIPAKDQVTNQCPKQEVGFPCPKCGTRIWTSRQLIEEYGRTFHRRYCPSQRCDWAGKVELVGCVGAKT